MLDPIDIVATKGVVHIPGYPAGNCLAHIASRKSLPSINGCCRDTSYGDEQLQKRKMHISSEDLNRSESLTSATSFTSYGNQQILYVHPISLVRYCESVS